MNLKKMVLILLIIIIVVFLVAGGIYFYNKSTSYSPFQPSALDGQVGKEVSLDGIAINATGTPARIDFDLKGQSYVVYLVSLGEWPTEYIGKEVTVKGTLAILSFEQATHIGIPGPYNFQILNPSYSLKTFNTK